MLYLIGKKNNKHEGCRGKQNIETDEMWRIWIWKKEKSLKGILGTEVNDEEIYIWKALFFLYDRI